MRYISTESNDPYFNLAFEEYVLQNFKDEDYLLLWNSEPSIVVGKYQNVFEEVNLMEARRQGVPVLRRISGGGTVYHDKNNLNYSMIMEYSRVRFNGYDVFLEPMIQALNKMGISAAKRRSCDIAIEGLKISGSAQTIKKNRILHHGTLLFDSDLHHLHELLRPSEGSFESKAVKSFRSPVTNIKEHVADETMTLEMFKDKLLQELFPDGVKKRVLEERDIQEIRKLADEKYSRWDWNYGGSPKFTFTKSGILFGNPISVKLEVTDGEISFCEIISEERILMNRNFIGTRYDYDEIRRRLAEDSDLLSEEAKLEDVTECFF